MAKPQGRRSGSSTDEEGETSYGLETSPDREISVIIAAANPDSIVPGAANRTMARGFRATEDVTVPTYQEVRVYLDGQVRLTSNHCLFLLSRTDLAKNGVTVKAGFQGVTRGSLYVILQNSSGHDRKIEKGGRVCHGLTVHNSMWASQFQLKDGTFTEIEQEQPARPVWSAA